MPILSIPELARTLTTGQRLLGLDVGSKTVGLALSDVTRTVASPLATLRRGRFAADAAKIAAIVSEHGIGGIIVGLPVQMDGREGRQCQSVRQFAANLLAVADLPMALWDERLSTAAVERMLIAEADISRRRRAEIIDKAAAAYILQGALDRLRHSLG